MKEKNEINKNATDETISASATITEKPSPLKSFLRGIGWSFAFLMTFLAILLIFLLLLMWMFCNGPSVSARNTFVATMLETGNMKFVVSWYLSEEEILAITSEETSSAQVDSSTDPNLITISSASDNTVSEEGSDAVSTTSQLLDSIPDPDADGIMLVPISGRTFEAQLLIVRDPSMVQLATAYPFSSMEMEKNGYTVGEYCENFEALAAVNAGEFETPSGINWGGRPIGVVVCDGEVQFCEPQPGDVLVGFNDNDILIVAEVGHMTAEEFNTFVAENHIRDGASFKDISDGNTNHFTKLIMNGTPVALNGKGVGANPRTAIGQCADGTVLILVTDGRGTAGHLGATAQDLINIMTEYGAVNAANLDGGSSSSLYFDGDYRITSSFLPNSDASRRLPTAFIVTRN